MGHAYQEPNHQTDQIEDQFGPVLKFVTYGLRWSLLQPLAETSGTQVGTCQINSSGVCTPYTLTDYYEQSAQQALQGGAANNVGEVAFDLNGRYNGRSDFWNMPKNNIGPRLAIAYSPDAKDGFWSKVFGDQKSSIRAGYSLVYDHFGAATVNTFDTTGSFGLSTNLSNAPGTVNIATAPRFTSITSIPAGVAATCAPGRVSRDSESDAICHQLGAG